MIGLDNAGKTSIILSLQKSSNLLSYYKLNPTKGIQIVNLEDIERNLNIWDFGGQELYRKDHIENFKKYVDKINKIIFVVDVQDSKRYQESLNYFKQIIALLLQWNLKIDLDIFLHKFDPDFQENPELKTFFVIDLPKFVKSMVDLVPKTIFCKVFKTSIFTIFQKNQYI